MNSKSSCFSKIKESEAFFEVGILIIKGVRFQLKNSFIYKDSK